MDPEALHLATVKCTICENFLSLPLSAGSSKIPIPVQKTELLRAGEWEMCENAFFSLQIATACICLGPREKPLLLPWCCYCLPSITYFMPHVYPSVWGEGISLRWGTRSKAVLRQDYLAFPDLLSVSSQKWPLVVRKHACNTHKTRGHPTQKKYCGLQFPLSGLPLQDSQVKQHKGRTATFSVPPLLNGNSRSYAWEE